MTTHIETQATAVAIWATPRSVSTALEKAVSLAPGARAVHEPFTDCYYFGPTRRSRRYGESPHTSRATGDVACRDLLAGASDCAAGRQFLVFKDLAFQARPYVTRELLARCRHAVILRDPRLVYASLLRLKPDFTEDEFGFEALLDLMRKIRQAGGTIRTITDGTRLRAQPEATLRHFCRAHGLRFSATMLSWRDGAIRTWAEHERLSQARWHSTLERSTGFLAPDVDPAVIEIAPEHRDVVAKALDMYQSLQYETHALSGDAANPESDLAHVTLRVATAADHDAVVACVKAAYTPYIAEIGVTPAPLHDDYADHIAHERVWVVASSDGEVVGMMVILVDGDHLLLDNYAVRPEWQNHGVSKLLTTRAKQEARRLGLGKLRLYTNAKMTKNLALYRRRGWIEVERRTEHGFDRVYMERSLSADEGWQ